MTAFDRAEAIAASIDHRHQGPNETCAIRDRILSTIHEEKAELSRQLESEQKESRKFYHLYCDTIFQRDEARLERVLYQDALERIYQRLNDTVPAGYDVYLEISKIASEALSTKTDQGGKP